MQSWGGVLEEVKGKAGIEYGENRLYGFVKECI